MTDLLIVGDTERHPELRHEVPVRIGDTFVFAEVAGTRHVVLPSMELDRVRDADPAIVCHAQDELRLEEFIRQGADPYSLFVERCVRAVALLGVERATVPRRFPLEIADVLRARGVELTVDQPLFDARRRRKTAAQLEGIRRAQRAAEAGMTAAADLLRRAEQADGGYRVDGAELTCELIKEHVERAIALHGATAEELIVAHGPQAATGHDPGSGPIAADDHIVLDLFPMDRESCCFADMTRTFALGSVDPEIREWHRLCKEALDLCVATIRPGLDGAELHRQVCDFFAGHGQKTQLTKAEGEVLEEGFYHATGHGVGLAVHEQPSIGRVGQPFVVGDVLAVEPGLYRKGFGGVRLEDLVLVTDDGCEVLTRFPYELEVL